ncbi:MAG: hypothetical protein ABIS07_08185 [Dokdonella sp.]
MKHAWVLAFALAATACARTSNDANTVTLYRSSAVPGDPVSRYHVATFDSSEAPPYNQQNCDMVARLWAESGVQVRYWCEKGRFHL